MAATPRKQAKRNAKSPKSPPKLADSSDSGHTGVVGDLPKYERPRASRLPAIFFGCSALLQMVLIPTYAALKTTGMVGRSSYPSNYAAPGLVCEKVVEDGPKFCEHELLFHAEGLAVLSCDPGRHEWNTVMGPLRNPEPRGKLWLFDYADTKNARELDLSGFPDSFDFHPLGLESFTDSLKSSLFVVNHQRTGPSIEIFSLDPSRGMSLELTYQRSIPASSDIKSANAIAALSHDEIYVTNDHVWPRLEQGSFWAMTESVLNILWAQTWITHIHIPSLSTTRAYTGFPFANGIAKGTDGSLYVASSSAGSVSRFEAINASTPLLRRMDEIKVGYSIDNIHIIPASGHGGGTRASSSSDGDDGGTKNPICQDSIVAGGHPSFITLIQQSKYGLSGPKSPSWISLATPIADNEEQDHKSSGANDDASEAYDGKEGQGQAKQQGGARETTQQHKRDMKPHEPTAQKGWRKRTLFQDSGSYFQTATGGAIDFQRGVLVSGGLYETGVLVCTGLDLSAM